MIASPGLLCTSDLEPEFLAELKRHGYEWCAPQVQNAHVNTDRDLARIKAAGLRAPVWGVGYSLGDMSRDGFNLGARAVMLGATDVIGDLEEFAKGTRDDRKLRPYIAAIRRAGWNGPVHLSTLGAPDNPDANDYAIDAESFLETGGGVLPQAYANAHAGYSPEACVRYWTRVGVPRDRINLMIGLHTSEASQSIPNNRIPGAGWVALLKAAGVARNFSIFLAEHVQPGDLDGLDPLSLAAPPPASGPTTASTRKLIVAAGEDWEEAQGGPKPLTRITLAKRISSGEIADRDWKPYGQAIAGILDAQE